MVGGTSSELSGGKFANGAMTAAFSYAFSRVGAGGQETGEHQEGANAAMNGRDVDVLTKQVRRSFPLGQHHRRFRWSYQITGAIR